MITLKELSQFSRVDIEVAEKHNLINAETISIDPSIPLLQRMTKYLEQIKNPYCFLCGETPVKIQFAPKDINNIDLGEKLKRYFLALKRESWYNYVVIIEDWR